MPLIRDAVMASLAQRDAVVGRRALVETSQVVRFLRPHPVIHSPRLQSQYTYSSTLHTPPTPRRTNSDSAINTGEEGFSSSKEMARARELLELRGQVEVA